MSLDHGGMVLTIAPGGSCDEGCWMGQLSATILSSTICTTAFEVSPLVLKKMMTIFSQGGPPYGNICTVDDRMIHGQTVTRWAKEKPCDGFDCRKRAAASETGFTIRKHKSASEQENLCMDKGAL